MIRSIEHIAIVAADPAALARWYCDTLGFKATLTDDVTQTYFVSLSGGGMLEIMPSNDHPPGDHAADDAGIRHIALAVDDFDKAYQALKNQGVDFVGPYRESPNGTRFDFFPDPEGNLLQLLHRPHPL